MSGNFVHYVARVEDTIEYRPGTWNGLKVAVYGVRADGIEERLGEYTRNYSSQMETFHPFSRNGRDFALYSPDYTGTRILSLPDCKDIGGEARDTWGFCPVEYYVPRYIKYRFKDDVYYHNEEGIRDFRDVLKEFESDPDIEVLEVGHFPYGWVSGCVWGDDSSWKVQHLDLSRAEEGILIRDPDVLGYIELPYNMMLRQAIDLRYMDDGPESTPRVVIATATMFDLRQKADQKINEAD